MAVKSEHVLVAACLFSFLLNNFVFISCATTTETPTTIEVVTTTEPATTQPPTTTTTALPTLPPTQVQSVTGDHLLNNQYYLLYCTHCNSIDIFYNIKSMCDLRNKDR